MYAGLVQVLDDTSLSLIIRDAENNGRSAIRILRRHYLPKGKPRVITLYTELTSLVKTSSESVTDYIIRAETSAAALKNAGEVIQDSLLVAMVLKGLPREFKPFTTVVTQKEKATTFSEFKVALRNYEDTEKLRTQGASGSTSVIMTNSTNRASNQKPKRWCSNCKMNNHDTEYCRRISQNPSLPASKKKGRWCDVCRSNTHDTRYCRKLTKLRQVKCDEQEDKDHESHFVFGLDSVSRTQDQQSSDAFLGDSGATVHVITDKTRFIRLNTISIQLTAS